MTTTPLESPTNRAAPTPSSPSFRGIAIYIVAVLGLGWLGPLVDHATGGGLGEGPGQLLWILLPVGAATTLRWKAGDGFADTGFRPQHRQNRPLPPSFTVPSRPNIGG